MNFLTRVRASVSLSIFLLLAGRAHAQIRVEGDVHLADGSPLSNATVRIEAPDYRKPLVTTTDAEGHYAFDEVKPGIRVRVVAIQNNRAVAESYALLTLWVEDVNLKEELTPLDPGSTEYIVAADGPSGEVAGRVLTADGRALAAAKITVGDTTLSATTDSAGRYAIPHLRPGAQVDLHASAPGFQTASQPITIVEGNRLGINFTLDGARPDDATGQLGTLERSADGSRITTRPDQVAGVPSLARKDVFRALQFQPGVAGSVSDTSELYVRGGTPDQTLVTIDGINLYQFSDPLGAFTAYNMDTVEEASLSSMPSDAGGGGRLSSALRMNGRAVSGRTWSGFADVSALGLNALVNASIGDRVSVLVAGRRSAPTSLYNDILDQFLPTAGTSVRSRLPRFSGGSLTTVTPTSDFHDLNAKVAVKATTSDRVSFTVYDGRNDVNASHDLRITSTPTSTGVAIPETSQLPSDAAVQVSRVGNWTSRGLGGTWQHQWSPSASTSVSVARSEYTRKGDQAWELTGTSTGQDYSFTDLRGGSDGLTESGQVRDTTVRADNTVGIGFAHSLSAGAEVSALDVSYAAQTEVVQAARSGTFSSGLADLINTHDSGVLTTFYAQDAWRPVAKLILSPGLRVVHYDRTASSYFEPRVNASYQVLPVLRVKGGLSVDHQVINLITREDRLHGDGAFWSLSDGTTVPVPRAVQASAGASLDVNGVIVSVDAYTKQLDDLTLFAPRLFPGVPADPGQTLFYNGSGTSRGIGGQIQYKAARNSVWAGYTVSKTEYTYPTLEASPFPAPFDSRNEFKFVDAVRIASTWSVSGAWIAASGRPYTPATGVDQVIFPSGVTVYEVTFDAKNSARLPFYSRLDVGSQKDFVFRGIRNSLGGTVFNVFDRQNILYYEHDLSGQSLSAHAVSMMGRTYNLFFRVGF